MISKLETHVNTLDFTVIFETIYIHTYIFEIVQSLVGQAVTGWNMR